MIVEGLATGIAGPTALSTALRAVPPADTGAAAAAASAAEGRLAEGVLFEIPREK
jgi:hypothetical protein